MKIKRVEIDNCFNLKDLNLDLKDGRILIVGPNGSGKTNIIKCITFIVKQLTACSCLNTVEKPENKCNDKKSTIKLHFDLRCEEILTVLKMRLLCVLSHCCTLSLEKTTHEQKVKFLTNVLQELYEKTCTKKENETCGIALTIEWTRKSDKVRIELDETIFQDFISKEKEVIKKESEDPDTKFLAKALEQILDKKKFLEIERQSLTETRFPAGVTPSELPCLKQLQEDRKEIFGDEEFSLDALVAHFLQTSVCIVPQSRGSLPTEFDSPFWDIAKVEEKLVIASLRNSDSTNAEQLENFKSAMLRIAGLEFKVAEGETPFSDVKITSAPRPALSGWSHSVHECQMKKETKQSSYQSCVMLKNRHAGDKYWEPLLRCSRGERELLVILSAYYLSGSDNVIFDEPGQSFHPPQQAQLRRLLERKEDGKVLLAITHSLEMISPQWIPNLYHMHQDEDSYTASSVTHTSSNNGEMAMLMTGEMRQIFFSSGVIFVEGINDQRVLKVLREVKLEDGASVTQSNVDRWGIIPMNGCHNTSKSYNAASRLRIPFVIVLDGDKGKKIQEKLEKTMQDKVQTKDPSEVRKTLQIWTWEQRKMEEALFLSSVTNKIENCAEVMCELFALDLVPDPKGPVNIQASSTLSSATNDSRVKMFENMVEKPINELLEKTKEKLNGIKESISHEGETEIDVTFHDLWVSIKNLPRDYDKAIKDETKQNKINWMKVADSLHDSKWKFLSWKTLKKIVKLAIEVPEHPFNELWKYLTKNGGPATRVIPGHTTKI